MSVSTFAFLVLGAVAASPAFAKPTPKVEICHIPPGNPANAHTINVSGNAIKAHLKHGDYLGPCEPLCEETCDDGNACTIDECLGGDCVHSSVDCNDGNQCTADSCNTETGGCESVPLAGDPCTDQDGSACTLDSGLCNASGDCELTAIPDCCESDAECADADLCTFEACTNNECVSDGAVACTPDDACEQSGCDAATGACVDLPVVCEPPGPCESGGYCDPVGGCTYAPIPGCCLDDEACDNGDPCTTDTCFNYACEHDVCHDPVSACEQYDTCDDQCVPIITSPTDCGDGDLCTDDDCDPVDGCLNPPTDCDDGSVCTTEFCDPELGCGSDPVVCEDDGDPCTVETCGDPDGCASAPKCNEAEGEICNPVTGACEVELICNFSTPDSNSRLFFMDGYNLLGVNPLELPFTGSAKIICDTYTPDGTAQRVCSAEFLSVEAMFIPIIGDICLVPMPAEDCTAGLIDCQPGNDLDVELVMNHTIPMPGGTCAVNQDCRDECESHCTALGATRFDNSPACEGYCRLSDTGILCTHDDDPPDANSCSAGDTCDEVNHADTCSCQCQRLGNGSPVSAGQARLEIGYGININFINPSTGMVEGRGPDMLPCTADDEPQGTLPPTCFPFTTTTATTAIENANNVGAGLITTVPTSDTGAPFMCTSGVVLSTSGAELRGVGDFIDTRLYDFAATLTVNCE